jgi:hypothetical protein
MNKVDEAIEIIKHSQDTHRQWLDWIEWHETGGGCPCDVDAILLVAGDKEHQQSRIERYQLVLDVLESFR